MLRCESSRRALQLHQKSFHQQIYEMQQPSGLESISLLCSTRWLAPQKTASEEPFIYSRKYSSWNAKASLEIYFVLDGVNADLHGIEVIIRRWKGSRFIWDFSNGQRFLVAVSIYPHSCNSAIHGNSGESVKKLMAGWAMRQREDGIYHYRNAWSVFTGNWMVVTWYQACVSNVNKIQFPQQNWLCDELDFLDMPSSMNGYFWSIY